MAAGPFILYNSVALLKGNGSINFATHQFRIGLLDSGYTPDLESHQTWAHVNGNEIAGTNGYTTGGGLLTGVSWTRSAGVAKFTTDNFVWTASGGPITARYGVIYSVDAANNELVGYYLLDSGDIDVTATAGNTFTVGPNATNGWFLDTVNPT